MYGVYELYTWDDVSYTLKGKFETQEQAEKEKQRLADERAKEFKPSKSVPVDPISFKIMTDLQYHLLMTND